MMRKRGRSVVSLFLAMAMVLSMASPVFAVNVPEDSQIVDQVEVTPNGGDPGGNDAEPGESEPPQSSEESPKPEGSEAPTESIEPEESGGPEESEAPVEPSETPEESEKPEESETPEESKDPTESENPEESQAPAESETPVESEKPEETVIPTESVTPTASVEPTESVLPVETLKPFEVQLDPMKTMLPQLFSDIPFEGDGTAENPYIIDSFEDMDTLHTYGEVDSVIYYELAANIVVPEDSAWTPIGTEGAPFKGVFNGAGYSIEGLTINSSEDYQGLFGFNAGLIYDLSVYGTVSGGNYVGGIVAVNTGSIYHSLFNGAVTGKDYVGGIVGLAKGVWSEGVLNGTENPTVMVGDMTPEYHEISKCYTAGEVTGENYVGGIAGSIDEEGAVWSSYSVANITGEDYVGGIAGKMATVTDNGLPFIDNVFALGTVSGATNAGIICGATADENGLGCITGAYIHKMQNGEAVGNGESAGVTVLDPYDFGNSAVMSIDSGSFEMNATLNHPVLKGLEPDDVVVEKVRFISSVDELKAFRDYVNSGKETEGQTWSVTEDIDLTDEVWTPIGTSSYHFKGTFDGQEHTISGLLGANYGPGGLFGYNMGTIKNVTVSGTINGSNAYQGGIVGQSNGGSIINCVNRVNVTGANYTGGIVGYANNTTISGCVNEGEIRNYGNNGYNYYGGIVGYISGDTKVIDCNNTGTVYSYDYVGGIVGYMDNTGTVSGCENSGAVTATYRWVGGIVGAALGSGDKAITNCTNSGTVTHTYSGNDSGRNIGGIIGRAAGVTIDGCTNTADIETNCCYAGGIVGYTERYPVTITNCKNEGNITDSYHFVGGILGYSYTNTTIENCENTGDITGSQYVGGMVGHSNSTIMISDSQNSGAITSNYNGDSYVGGIVGQARNSNPNSIISCSNEGAIKGYNQVGGIAGYYWGDMDDCHNTGRINGVSYVGGLVGQYNNGWPTLRRLSNSDNSGVVIGSNQYVGGLIGYAYGYDPGYFTITNCSNTNDVMNARESGDGYVGGLIGYGYRLTLEDSYNTGNINGNFNVAGGIFGAWDGQTNIYRCYNSGNISCSNGSYIGGIIGYAGSSDSNWKYCQDSYNTGTISGKSAVGGIMGGYYTSWGYHIINCYNFGNVSATNNYCGSISGYDANQDYYTNNYFLYGTASGGVGQPNSTDGTMQGGRYELLTEEKFTNKEAFNTWDFDSVWMISDSLGRPILRSIPELSGDEATYQTEYYQQSIDGSYYKLMSTSKSVGRVNATVSAAERNYNGFEQNTTHEDSVLRGVVTRDGSLVLKVYYNRTHLLEGSGTSEEDPYQIKTRADLEAFASFVTDGWDTEGTYWQVMNDIDLENDQWTPIGTSTNVFKGTFSGGEHTVSGIYINERNASYRGLFSYNAGTIKDLTVSGRVVGATYTGAIVGQNNSGAVIDNCRSEATVTGYGDYVGGIVGVNGGTIKNSENAGDVIHPHGNYAGGLAGYNNGGTVEYCTNNGSVTSTGTNYGYAGGIVGANGTVRNCHNNGSVISTGNYVGGISGGISGGSGTINNCENHGVVKSSMSGDVYIGGIVGSGGDITASSNWADVVAYGNYVGGIAGGNAYVYESFNAGNVSAYGNGLYAGGIVGGYSGSTYYINDCYNTGSIRSAVYAGGIVGNRHNGNNQIYRCYNYGPVSAQNYCGAIAGQTYNINTGSCFYLDGTCDKAFGNPSGAVDVAVMLTEAKFAEKSSFTGFSFSDKWVMSKTLGRPILRNAPEEGYVTLTVNDGETTEVQAQKGIRLMDAYSFDYSKVWQDSSNSLVNFDAAITSNLSVTAVEITEGMEVNYQIKHRRKNLSNSYDEEIEMRIAHVGDTVTATPKDYEGFHVVDVAEDVEITSNMQVLTINYERDEFTVTFEMGESGLENTTQTVLYGGNATAPSKTTWAKHEFVGWFTTDTGPINFNFNTPVTENITVYGRWNNRYKVSFITSENGTHISEQYVVPGTRAMQPSVNPTKPGYAFAGWYTDAECTKEFSFNTNINANTDLYAKWLRGLTVHFEVGEGATPVEDQTVVKDGTATQPKNPSKYGYAFGGWYADKELTRVFDFNTKITANIIIYAKWDKPYVVTFETGEGASKVDSQEVAPGEKVQKPSVPTRDGFVFGGWYTTADYTNEFNFSTTINNNITLYAKWGEGLAIPGLTGMGTSDDPYQISNKAEYNTAVNWMNNNWNNTHGRVFVLTTDIDLENSMPRVTNSFYGVLDGQGYTIKNIYYYSSSSNISLFRYNYGTLKNLTFEGSISKAGSSAVLCCSNFGAIEGCINRCYSGDSSGYNYHGGLVYSNEQVGTISRCINEADVYGYQYKGGIAYINSGLIEDCANIGTIQSWGSNYHGGIVQNNTNSGHINRCYNFGSVPNSSWNGAIAGQNSGTITDCYYLTGTNQYGVYSTANSAGHWQVLTAEEFTDQANFANWDFDTVWKMSDERPVLRGMNDIVVTPGVIGSEDKPQIIKNAYGLISLAEAFASGEANTAYVKLGASIDLAGVPMQAIGSETNPFNGVFDGNGYTLKNLSMEAPLFGANSGTIRALTIEGNVSGNAGIIGTNSGTVFQCSFNGTVSGTDHVGGIVGVNTTGATVEQCYVKGTVTGSGVAGGITGSNAGSVVDCYNMATVNGATVGGIAGDGAGTVTNCYNGGALPEGATGVAKDATQTGTYTLENTVADSKATALTEKKTVEFASYEGWNFGDVWGMHIVYGRPVLLALEEAYDGGKISESSIVIETPGAYTVIGDADTSVKNNISITNPGEYNLTIKNVSNNMSEKMEAAGIGLCDGAEVRLTVVGRNTITAGAPNAGIQVPETAKLYMTGNGSITATGGTTFNVPNLTPEEAAKYNGGGAGIGGGLLGTSGYIEIDMEGYVYANGSPNMYFGAAGIGGGSGSAASMASDNNCNTTEIVIKNGIIHAKGSINTYYGGAGIGGGSYGRGENITISGGRVIAEASPDSHYGAAGIGGGSVDSSKNNSTDASGNPLGIVTPGADGANITINGTATVTAIRSTETLTNGAGIGGGNFGHGHDIIIDTTGLVSVPVEATVTLNDTGAGIGGGCYGNGYNIEIKNGTVNVNSAVTGAGIGGGTGGNGYDITISGGKVTATAQHHDSIDGGAGIGGGMGGHAENVTITSKDNLTLTTVTAIGSYNAAGIGGGGNSNEYNNLNADGETVLYGEITNNKTYTKDITITGYVDVTATGKNKGAGIGGGGYGYAHNILINGTGINKSSVKAYSINVNTGPYTTGAGIGGGYGRTGIAVGIEITGNVAVSATADSYSSGIGGGQSAMAANIYIHGENTTVYAKGGNYSSDECGTAIGASSAPAVNIRLENLTSTDVKGYDRNNNVIGQNSGYAVTVEGYNNAIGGSGNFDINTMNPFGDIVLNEELRDYDYVVADIKITNSNVWAHNQYGQVAIGGRGGDEGKTSIANIKIAGSKLYVRKYDNYNASAVAIGIGASEFVDLNIAITDSPMLNVGSSGQLSNTSEQQYYPSPLIGARTGYNKYKNGTTVFNSANHINEKIVISNVDQVYFYCNYENSSNRYASGCIGLGSYTSNSISNISITNCKSIISRYTRTEYGRGGGISSYYQAIPGIGMGHNSYDNTMTATIENCGSVGLGAGIGLGGNCYNNTFTASVTNCGDLTAGYIGTMGGCHDNVVDIDINTPLTDGSHSITAQSIGMGIGCSQTTDTAKCDINIDGYTGGMTITPVTSGSGHPNVGIGIGGESRSTDPNIPLNADIFINNCGTLTFNLNGYSTGIGVGNGSYGNVAGNINITNCDDINMHCTSNSCYQVTGIGVGSNSYSSGAGCGVKPEITIENCGIINMRLSDASTGIGVGGRSRTSADSSIINPHIDIHDCEGIVMTLGAYTTGIGMGFGSYNNFPDMAKVTADIDITRCGNFDINIGDSSVGMGVGGYLMAGNLTQAAHNVALDLDITECGKMKIETEDTRGTSMTTNRSGVGIGVGYRYHDTNEVDNGNSRINIDIVGSGDTLAVTGSENGAAIGTGKAVYDRAKMFVNISNMDIVAKAGDNTAAIGVGADCNGAYDKGTINISNSDVKATGGAGVGVGQLFTDGSFTVNLTDCSVESNALHGAGLGFAADAVRSTFTSTLTNCTGQFVGGGYAAGMGMGRNSAGSTANITILGGNITAKGSNGGAGIGCGPFGSNCTPIITIDDNATVTAIGSASTKPYSSIPGVGEVLDEVQANRIAGAGAGIGGAESQNAGQITINSGTVTATGASLTDYNAAGIGGGKNGDGGITLITGGTVTATSGYTETDGAAGIGGGYGGNGGSITITGGNVTANGMGGISSGGAGIGGGPFGNGGDVVIYGNAIVNAIGSERASGIGGGFRANGHDVKIYGGKDKNGEPDATMQPTVIAKSGLYDAAAIGGGAGGGDGGDVFISAVNGIAPIVKAYGYSSTVAIPGDITCEGVRLIQGTMKDTYDYDLALRVQNKVEEGETPADNVNAVLPATYDAFSVTVMDTNDGAKTYNVYNIEEVEGVEQKYLLSTFAEDKFDFDLENDKDYHALQLTIIKYYTVSYDTGEGGPEVPSEAVRGEMAATQPTDPEWEGHIFSGWYADPEFTTVFDFSTPITENTTVYAKWIELEPSQILYKVEHYKQDTDGDGYYLFLTDYFVGVFGDEVSAEYKEITGFHKNRTNPDTLLEGTLSDEEALTMKCFYDRDIIRVLLLNVDATQGQGGFIEAPYGTSVMLAMPSKGGYEFDKWTRLNPDGEEVPFMTLMKIETLGPAVYANWTLKAGCAYQVRHFLRGLDGIYTLDMQEDFAAAVGDEVIAEPYSYTGFHVNESISEESRKGIAQEDNSTVLRIYYDRDIITVNLIDSYNDELTEVTKQYGDVASIPTPYREGYIFKGWHKDDGDLIDDDALINEIGENATAYWEPIIVEEVANYSTRYHFQTPDGLYVVKEIVDQIGLIGDLVHAPIKTFVGYTFNKDKSNYTGVVDDKGTLALNLYYDLNLYEVEFDSDGGSYVAPVTNVQHGTSINAPRVPTKTGYEFLGWYDEGLTVEWDFRNPVMGNMTLYAKWDAGTSAYKVEHYIEDLDGKGYTLYGTDNLSEKTGSMVSATVKEIKGFAQNKKHPLSVLTGKVTENGSLMLKVYYDRIDVLVKYESNGGTDFPHQTVKYGSLAKELAPTKAGYDFTYWCADHSLQKEFDFETPITETTTLYAKWTPRNDTPFTTLYYLEDPTEPGAYHLNEDMTVVGYGTTEKVMHALYPDVDGYHVNEDHPDANVVDIIRGDGSMVLEVYYSCNDKTVTFEANGGTLVDAQSVPFGSVATEAETTKQGYTFMGWYSDEALTESYDFETAVLTDITLYAKWEAAETSYKVEHYLQTVSQNGYDLESTETFAATTGTTVTAKALKFVGFHENKEYTFRVETAEVNADGTTTLKLFYDRDIVTLTFDTQGGTPVEPETTVYGGIIPAPGNPSKAGYRFGYWYEYPAMTGLDEVLNVMERYANGEINVLELREWFVPITSFASMNQQLTDLGFKNTASATAVSKYNLSYAKDRIPAIVDALKTDSTAYKDGHLNITWYQMQYYLWKSSSVINTEIKSKGLISPADAYDYWVQTAKTDRRPQWLKDFGTSGDGVTEYGVRVLADGTQCLLWGTPGEGLRHDFNNPVTRNMTVYAKWFPAEGTSYKENYYYQNINDDNYTLVGTVGMAGKTGETAMADTTAPYGFHLNEDAVGSRLSGEITADGKLVLNVYFDRNLYTVTYDEDGGENVEDSTVRYGGTVEPAETTKAGYTFLGWYKDGKKFNFNNEITENIMVTAGWELRNDVTYTVEYYAQTVDKNGYELTKTEKGTGSITTEVKADTTAPTGFVFNPDVEGTLTSGTILADGSLVLKVFFARKNFTMSFDANGGSDVEDITAIYGEVISSPETTKKGYIFDGWLTEDGEAFDFTKGIDEDYTLTAKWIAVTGLPFRINYYYTNINSVQGDAYILKETVKGEGSFGQVITADTTEPQGYTLNKKTSVVAGTLTVDEELILDVYFDAIGYTVTYETNGGSKVEDYSALYGEVLTAPVTTRKGYTFDGWWVGKDLEFRYDFTKPVTEDMTLYAKWVESGDVPYRIEYYYQNINDDGYEMKLSKDEMGFVSDYIVAETDPAPAGFVLNTDASITEGQVSLDETLVLKVYYDRIEYTLSFEANGGKDVDSITGRYGKKVSTPKTTKLGYELVGWYVDEDLTTEYDFSKGITGNMTLYAKWVALETVTFKVKYYYQNINNNNYTWAKDETVTGYGVVDQVVLADTEAQTGFHLNESKTTATGKIKADGSLTLEVYFDRDVYELTFHANDGEDVDPIYARYGKIVTSPMTSRDGYVFKGWFVDEDLRIEYDFNVPISGDAELYAKWKPVNSIEYMVNYYYQNINDDNYTLAASVERYTSMGSTVTADTTAPEGFVFNGDVDGTVLTGDVKADGSLVLSVYFDRLTYTLTFDTDDGTEVSDITARYGKILTSPVTKKPGYEFLGWFEDEAFEIEHDFTVPVASDHDLHAKWLKLSNIPYIINYYQENLTDDEYTLVKTVEGKGAALDIIKPDATSPTGFMLNDNSDVEAEILTDGSLVMNVYFDRKLYDVAFESNEGSGVDGYKVKHGVVITEPETTREGYTFLGWFTNEELTRKYDFSAPVTAGITLYAKWEVIGNIKYTVKYYEQNINDDEYTLVKTEELKASWFDTVTADTTAPTGFTLNTDSVTSGNIKPDGSLVLEVYFDRNLYTVNFETNGGSEVKRLSVRHGKQITAPATTKAGYTFSAWFADKALSTEYDFTAPVTHDATLYAGWNALGDIKYTIKYYEQNINDDEYTLTDTVTKTAHVGDEVIANATASTGFVVNEKLSVTTGEVTVDEALVLEVYYDRNVYTINFETNGGSGVKSMTVKHGKLISAPVTTKAGYSFSKWFTDEVLATEYDFTTPVTHDATLYAGWNALDTIEYTIKYYRQNINNDEYSLADTVTKTGHVGDKVSASAMAPTGFVWNEDKSSITGNILADGSLMLEVYFDRVTYTVHFETNGGATVDDMTVKYGYVMKTPVTTKVGHTFEGWFTDAELTTEYDFTLGVTGDHTLYAKWSKLTNIPFKVLYYYQNINDDLYTLVDTVEGIGSVDQVVTADTTAPDGFILNEENSVETGTVLADGSLVLNVYFDRILYTIDFETNGGSAVDSMIVRYGKVVTAPKTFLTGHDLGGWFVDAELTNEYDFTAPVTSNTTVYAKWVSWGNMEFQINYYQQNIDGKTYELLETVTGYGSVDQVITAEKQPDVGFHVNTETSVSTGSIEAGKILVLNVYFDRDTHTIKFETNGGSAVAEAKVLYGSTVASPASTKSGHTLAGWYTEAELTTAYDFTKAVEADMTLFAKWNEEVKPTPTPKPGPSGGGGGGGGSVSTQYTVDFNSNGGTEVPSQKVSSKVTEPKAPEKQFFQFDGWFTDKELTKPFDFKKDRVKADTTLFAKWSYMGPSTYLNMEHIAYIMGKDDGLVHPESDITRAEVAMIFYRLLNEDTRKEFENSRSAFKDVKQGDWYLTAVSTLARMGILKGRGDGYFDPKAPITRAEFAVICSRFDTLDEIEGVKFSDVPKTYWAYKEIGSAAAKGWVEGIGGDKFAPNALISRAEAVTLINRVLGRATTKFNVNKNAGTEKRWDDNRVTDWYYWSMQEATNSHDYKLNDKTETWNKIYKTK